MILLVLFCFLSHSPVSPSMFDRGSGYRGCLGDGRPDLAICRRSEQVVEVLSSKDWQVLWAVPVRDLAR